MSSSERNYFDLHLKFIKEFTKEFLGRGRAVMKIPVEAILSLENEKVYVQQKRC